MRIDLKYEDIPWILGRLYYTNLMNYMGLSNKTPNVDPEISWTEPKYMHYEYDLREDEDFWNDLVENITNIK